MHDTQTEQAHVAARPSRVPTAPTPEPPPAPTEGVMQVAALDPPALDILAARGFGLGKLVAGSDAATTAKLARMPSFKSIFDVLAKDVRDAERDYPPARVTTRSSASGSVACHVFGRARHLNLEHRNRLKPE